MKTIQKFLQALFLTLGFFLLVKESMGQQKRPASKDCTFNFQCTVEGASKGKKDGKLYLTLVQGEGEFTFKLYDLYHSKNEFMATVQLNQMKVGEKVLVFKGLSASTYVVHVIGKDCQRTLGGLDGFTINEK